MSNNLMEKKELTEEMSKKEMMDYLIEVKPKMAAVVPTLDKEQISKLYRIVRKEQDELQNPQPKPPKWDQGYPWKEIPMNEKRLYLKRLVPAMEEEIEAFTEE